ncbi:conserved hypothetical protein [Bradyrhizobium sp. ORS 375]|nr:conserved hypothetical protein [Bradyrhizobium sp. ORS 375]
MVIAPVEKQIRVRAPINHAFAVFTSGLTRWWPHTHGVGGRPIDRVLIEPKLGGRWLEISDDGTQTVVATITLWEPPQRFVMLWQIDAQWKPDAAMRSEVDVRFFAEDAETTRVELVHHKFETMGEAAGASMRRDVDGGWPGLLQRFAAEAERPSSSS